MADNCADAGFGHKTNKFYREQKQKQKQQQKKNIHNGINLDFLKLEPLFQEKEECEESNCHQWKWSLRGRHENV